MKRYWENEKGEVVELDLFAKTKKVIKLNILLNLYWTEKN